MSQEEYRNGWVCKFVSELDEFETEENPNLIGMGDCPFKRTYVNLDFCAENCRNYRPLGVEE